MAAITCNLTLARVLRIISHVHSSHLCHPGCYCADLIQAFKEEVSMAKEIVHTPSDLSHSTSTKSSGNCTYNGEPGLPGRTTSPSSIAEVTYDQSAGLKHGEKK